MSEAADCADFDSGFFRVGAYTDRGMVLNLYTRDGAFVVTVTTLPWKTPPEVLVWGERVFVLRGDGKWYEGLAVVVTV